MRGRGTREEWSDFAQAMGDVVIPFDKEVRLDVSLDAASEPTALLTIRPEALHELSWVSSEESLALQLCIRSVGSGLA